MDEAAFKARTQALGLRVITLVEALPRRPSTEVIGRQLLRSATSVGANYRAACRSRSTAEMISKLSVAEEEADETLYWLDLLDSMKVSEPRTLADIRSGANEIVAMLVASIQTLRARPRGRT